MFHRNHGSQRKVAYRWVGEGGRDPRGDFVGDTRQQQLGNLSEQRNLLEGGVDLGFGTPKP